MTQKFIVTGAAGFIGSWLAQRLLERGDQVIGVDCFTDYYSPRIKRANVEPLGDFAGFTLIERDILELDWRPLLEGTTTVFHQAAQAGVRASWGRNFAEYTNLNVLATQTLLEALKGSGIRMVYASSSSVYGDTPKLPMAETDLPCPHSPYGVTKLAAEHLCGLYWRNFGVPIVALRYFTVYGPRQRPDMAFHRFIKAAFQGLPIVVYGDGEQTRDFTFVEDAVEANLAAARMAPPGAVYNIGGGSRLTLREAIARIEAVVGRPVRVERREAQRGDVRHTYADTTRARRDLQFNPQYDLDQGLAEEAAWVERSLGLLV